MACKNCNNKHGSIGLGDTIKSLASAMGFSQCSGCKKRQRILNQMFPYKERRG